MEKENDALIEVIESLASEDLSAQACQHGDGKTWYFGNRSNDEHDLPFWKMDLDGVAVFDQIWQAVQPRCEELAGCRLRVIRQYANGHTYGLGGQPHRDDLRPGTYTLLYYPMREWRASWQGETVFHDETGEIALTVTPRPNRAVFFDSRIPHAGRGESSSPADGTDTAASGLRSGKNSARSARQTLWFTSPTTDHRVISRKNVRRYFGARRTHGFFSGDERGRSCWVHLSSDRHTFS